jgi:DNA-binding MarR family transcriptional regulator
MADGRIRPRGTLPDIAESQDTLAERQDTSEGSAADHVDRVIAQWAAIRPDLDLTPLAVVARLGRAAAFVDAGVNSRLADFGLTRESWDVLASLRRNGPPYRLSPTQLYVGLMRSSGAMTHRLARLEADQLVRRLPDRQDRRGLLVELTPSGLALVDAVASEHLANERRLLAGLTQQQQLQLVALLRTLLQSFEGGRPIPPPSGRGGRRRGAFRYSR